MTLAEYFAQKGNVFFRLRSYTPLLLVPLLYLERGGFRYPLDSHTADMVYELCCMAVSLTGACIRVAVIGHVPEGTSGRNTRRQKADQLNTTGLYSIVRNPLYLGNYFILLGVTLLSQSWELVVLNTFLFLTAYLPIIMTEERFLSERFGQVYEQYASRVPCLLPNLWLWNRSNRPFDLRMVLRREHDTWFTIVVSFVLIEHYREYIITAGPKLEEGWLALGVLSLAVWLLLKSLKHWTRILSANEP